MRPRLSGSLRRRTATVLGASVGVTLLTWTLAVPASAHHPEVTAQVGCDLSEGARAVSVRVDTASPWANGAAPGNPRTTSAVMVRECGKPAVTVSDSGDLPADNPPLPPAPTTVPREDAAATDPAADRDPGGGGVQLLPWLAGAALVGATGRVLQNRFRGVASAPDREPVTAPLPPVPGSVDEGVSARTAVLHLERPRRVAEPAVPVAPAQAAASPHLVGTAAAPVADPSPRSRRWRPGRLAWTALAILVALGALAAFANAVGLLPSTGRSPAAEGSQLPAAPPLLPPSPPPVAPPLLPPLPADADTPEEQLGVTTTALADLVTRDPDAAGPAAEKVLASLRQVARLDAGPRASAAIVAATSAGDAVAAEDLDPGVGRRVQEVLGNVARPKRLVDLVILLDADRSAVGPGGPELFASVFALDHVVSGDEVAPAADALVRIVTEGTDDGEFSEAFRSAALPKLQELADPSAYRALVEFLDDVEEDPGRIGPAGSEVLASLREIKSLPVFDQGNAVAELLRLVRQDGRVRAEFQDEAIPVLVPLVR